MSKKKKKKNNNNKNKRNNISSNTQKLNSEHANNAAHAIEEKSQAQSKIEAEELKASIKPKAPEPRRTPEEIERERNMTGWQRYKKSIADGWALERKTLSSMDTLKEKLGYIAYYHKWHILITFLVIFTIIYGAHAIITHKDYAFNCLVVNDSHNTVFSDALQKELSDCISYNPKKETIGVSLYSTDISNYEPGYYGGDAGCQAIFSLMMNYSIDAVIANDDVIEWFSRDDNFCNLEEILPSDLYKELEPYVVMLPDKSGKEHPYALDFSDTEVYKKGKSNLQSPRIAIFSTTRNLDEAIAAIEKLYGYSD